MGKIYQSEKEGQFDFLNTYGITFENNNETSVLTDNTDGIYHGAILEFKLNINDINKTLFQVIKYLSRERIKGKNVPGRIFLIDLNKNSVFEFLSSEYFSEIHKIYSGNSSKHNEGFTSKNPLKTFNLDVPKDKIEFLTDVQKYEYLKINIDENCIVGWAERYYTENPKATKEDFLKENGELRNPVVFKDFINPYIGESNEKFKYIMDKLNDKLKKKKLGAFYTPIPYCEKSAELVREAIKRVPEGNDYIILDRCAGTGNLESVLTDEELSHCVLSAYEYYEWLVLRERLEDKVRMILPENKEKITFENGLIKENDAMSKEFVENEYIKQFLNNEKCTIIIYENPPYAEETTNSKGSASIGKMKSFILAKMKEDKNCSGRVSNELSNRFIWSAWRYYQRQSTDSVILFSPIKYWKSANISNKELIKAMIFNRKFFHASPSAISCIGWKNILKNSEMISADVFDIDAENNIPILLKTINIKKCYNTYSDKFYDLSKDKDDVKGICCEHDGSEFLKDKSRVSIKPITNDNIIGYLVAKAFGFDNPSLKCILVRCGSYQAHGFYLRKETYLKKLPLFSACHFDINKDFYNNGTIFTTSDGGTKFEKDQPFLKSCLIYTSLCQSNKCLSFKGSDGRDYYNEICFDTLSVHKSQALIDLQKYTLNQDEKDLIALWNTIMLDASKTKNYNKNYSYGLYQIIQELNTFVKDKKTGKSVYDYPILNGNINTLKAKLKEYYKKYIEPKCFEYELLK